MIGLSDYNPRTGSRPAAVEQQECSRTADNRSRAMCSSLRTRRAYHLPLAQATGLDPVSARLGHLFFVAGQPVEEVVMKRIRPHPWDSTPIDAIDRRVAHLRGLFGVLGSAAHCRGEDELPLSREDLVNLTWLVEDYLSEIHEWAQRLHRAAGKEAV